MSTRMDRIKQGQAAKERVLSGMYNQQRTTSSARSSRNARMKAHQQKVSESVNNALTTGIDKVTDFITSPTVQRIAQGITNDLNAKSQQQKQQKQQTSAFLDSPLSMTSAINDQRDLMSKGMTPGIPVKPPSGYLMNNLGNFNTPTPTAPGPVPIAMPAPHKETLQEYVDRQKEERNRNAPTSGFKGVLHDIAGGLADMSNATFGAIPGIGSLQRGLANASGVAPDDPFPSGNGFIDKAAYVAGNLAGFALNPAQLEQNLFTAPYQAADALLTTKAGQYLSNGLQRGVNSLAGPANQALSHVGVQLAPKVTGNVAQNLLREGTAGAIQSAANSGVRGETDVKDMLANTALGFGVGGLGGAGLNAAGSMISSGLSDVVKQLFSRNGIDDEVFQDVISTLGHESAPSVPDFMPKRQLALPMGRGDAARARRANTVQTPDVMHGIPPAPLLLTEGKPLGLPAPNIAPPTTARIAQKVNPYRQQFETLMKRAEEERVAGRLSPGREDLEVESMWSQMAGPEGITLDELIQRAYPTRPNRVNPDTMTQARQYQGAREVAGAPMPVKSMADRYPQGGQTGIPDMPITVPARAPAPAAKPVKQTRVAASSRQPIKSKGALRNASGGRQQIQSKGALKNITEPQQIKFTTSKGSTYTVGEKGSTQRTKSLHQGHDPNDVGLKEPSEKTIYIDKDLASTVGAHGNLNSSSKPRIVIQDDGIYLVSLNSATGKWGRHGDKIPYSTTPEIGKAPLEFWNIRAENGLGNVPKKFHAGNEITEIEYPKSGSSKKSTTLPPAAQRTKEVVDQAQAKVEATPSDTPLTRPDVDDTAIVRGAMEPAAASEPAFVNTVRQSGNASPELQRALNEAKITAARTTDRRNLELAEKMIARDGVESAADRIIDKKGSLNAVENTAANVIAKYYADTGQLERAIQVISKTAASGRELGQAMQALTRWNKMSTEGALLMAERQLNRLTTKTEEWKSLTPDQAAPVAEVGNKLESVQAASQFAKEVTRMIAGRQKGAPFTAAEKDLIEQFSEQVRKTSEEVRPLVNKQRAQNNKDIAEVSRVKPKDRTRDQVQRLISAQADKARERLAASRNRLSSTPLDVWRDYVILGADYITKKTIKFADWSEAMIKEGLTKNLGKAYTDSVRKFRKENGLPASDELDRVVRRALKEKQIDDETASSLQAMASEIGFFADDVKLEMTQELQKVMRGLGTSTLGEKIASLQTSAMLLSPPTFLRNTLGNMTQMVLEKITKVAAVPIDWGFSKLTGERTIQFLPHNQEKYWRNFGVGGKSEFMGINPNGTLDAYGLTPNVFQSDRNPFKWLTQLTGASLKSGDYASYMHAYGDLAATYAEQIAKSQGLSRAEIKQQMPQLVKQLDDNINDLADKAGLYATYQDETLLSKGAQKLRQGMNSLTDVPFRKLREKGLHPNLSLEGFGLGDIALKFAKTPANLIMRGIDYSPIGFVRGLYELLPLVTGNVKNFNQYAATRSLSRAITGTVGLTGLGFILAKNGILTGASSNNPNVRSLQEQTGQGAYKANLTSLKRWVMSGFNADAAKYQQGDLLMDYNWLQPAAVSVGMGVNLAENLSKPDKPGREVPEWKKYSGAILGGLRTILENPMMTSSKEIVDAANQAIYNQDSKGIEDIAKGIPASFVPAVLGQVRSGKDQYQRETTDTNPLKSMLNMVMNKVPGLSEKLPVSYDSLGNERKRYAYLEPNTLGSYLTQLLNPTRLSSYSVSPEAQTVLDVLEETNDTGVVPKISKRSITYTDPKTDIKRTIRLSNEEFSQLQKRLGELVAQGIANNEQYLSNSQNDADAKAKKLEKILRVSGEKARKEFREANGYN